MKTGAFQPRLLQDGDIRLCIFPEGKELFIFSPAFSCAALKSVGAGQAEIRQRIQVRDRDQSPPMGEYLLILNRRHFRALGV